MKLLIKNGKVWDGKQFYRADILTDNKLISRIDSDISESADWIYDAKDAIVSAGLIDAHLHMRGVSDEAYSMYPESGCFPFGVTAAADAAAIYHDQKYLDALPVKTCVFVPVSTKDNHADFTQTTKLLEQYGDRVAGIKIFFDVTVGGISDITPLKETCLFAHNRALKVMVHSSNSPVSMAKLLDVLENGDILTHAFHGGANNAAEDGFAAIARAKKRDVVIDIGFAGYKHVDFGILEDSIRHGILPDTISTDLSWRGAFKRGGRYGLTMCMSIAKKLHMSEEEIFRAVTVNPARALGREAQWGLLKEGRCADIAVFAQKKETFDLTDSAGNRVCGDKSYRCILTVTNGIVTYKD